jgi:hypothetical protein
MPLLIALPPGASCSSSRAEVRFPTAAAVAAGFAVTTAPLPLLLPLSLLPLLLALPPSLRKKAATFRFICSIKSSEIPPPGSAPSIGTPMLTLVVI